MAYTKREVKDKAKKDPSDKKKYTIEADGPNEENIVVLFKSDGDADKAHKVDKLSTDGLPTEGDGVSNILWLNNFWIKKADGGYLDGVTYNVQLSKKDQTMVYFDGTAVHRYTGPRTDLPNNMVQIELNVGDPASGYGN